jgi:uncharacterized protein
MPISVQNEPLTQPELDRLGEFLKSCKGGRAMNMEEMDGFFSALIAGPEVVMPSEYMSKLFGGEASETGAFKSLAEANEILGLLMRHWNAIAGPLSEGRVHLPLLLKDENGVVRGNDWARGFIRETHPRHRGWSKLLADDDHGGCMIPMLMLCHEHDSDPEMRPEPIDEERRIEIIALMTGGLVEAYVYFRDPLNRRSDTRAETPGSGKIGRNELCPCGSGKKYKRCCGAMTIN